MNAKVLDLLKAFDCIPHALLKQKLPGVLGIKNHLLSGIHDFLYNRSQTFGAEQG